MDKRCNIRFFDKNLNFLGEVDNFTSLIFIKSWESYGEFNINISNFNKELFQKQNIIMINNNPFKVGTIEQVNVSNNNSSKITGYTLGFWFTNRITFPPSGLEYDSYNTNVEDIMKGLVRKNLVEADDPKRNINNLIIATSLGRGEKVSFQSRFKYVSDELTSLSKLTGIGWGVYLDIENKKFVFDIFEGNNLSAEQNILPPKIFSSDYDNVINKSYLTSDIDYKNVAIVAGQGEGVNREIQVVNSEFSGLDRKELFVDARDLDDNENLIDRGNLKLAENQAIETFECETINNGYEEEWDLGDIVTVLDKKLGYIEHNRVIEVMETYEDGHITIEPTFGVIASSFTDKIKEILNVPVNEVNKIIISDLEPTAAVGQIWIKDLGEVQNYGY